MSNETIPITNVPTGAYNQQIRDAVAKMALSMILGDVITIGENSLEVWSKSSLSIDEATPDMTQPVGVNSQGKLVTRAALTKEQIAEMIIGLT